MEYEATQAVGNILTARQKRVYHLIVGDPFDFASSSRVGEASGVQESLEQTTDDTDEDASS